jgi:hypothetical protein
MFAVDEVIEKDNVLLRRMSLLLARTIDCRDAQFTSAF